MRRPAVPTDPGHRPDHRARREVSLGASPSRMALLALLGVVLGGVGGVGAYLVVHLVGLISNLALLHRVGFDLPDLQGYHPSWVLVPTAAAGAAVVVGLARWSPIIRGHGIPESLEATLFRESRVDLGRRSPSRCRRRWRWAPAARSAPRARSSSPGRPSARSSASCSRSARPSGASSSRRAPPPAWPVSSRPRSPPSSWPSSCSCSSGRCVPCCLSASPRRSRRRCTRSSSARTRCSLSTTPPTRRRRCCRSSPCWAWPQGCLPWS